MNLTGVYSWISVPDCKGEAIEKSIKLIFLVGFLGLILLPFAGFIIHVTFEDFIQTVPKNVYGGIVIGFGVFLLVWFMYWWGAGLEIISAWYDRDFEEKYGDK